MTTQIRDFAVSDAVLDLEHAALGGETIASTSFQGLSTELINNHARNPVESLQGARDRLTQVIGSTSLIRVPGKNPIDEYLRAYAELSVQLDRSNFPATREVRDRPTAYIPDGFVDLGKVAEAHTVLRGQAKHAREKNVVDKAEILHQYAPLLEKIFAPEVANLPRAERELLVAKMIAQQVYKAIPYEDTDKGVGKHRVSEHESGVCCNQADVAVVLAQAAGLEAVKVKVNVKLGGATGSHVVLAARAGETWNLYDQTNPARVPRKRHSLEIDDVLVIPAGKFFTNKVGDEYSVRVQNKKKYTYTVANPSYWHIERSEYVDGDQDGGGHSRRVESRRQFLKGAGVFVGYLALDKLLGKGTKAVATLRSLESGEAVKKNEIVERANTFIGMELNEQRWALESDYWMWMASQKETLSAQDIRTGMSATFGIGGRSVGMELFWQKRQNGDFINQGHPPVTTELITWAQQNKVDPRTLAMAIDAQAAARKLMAANPAAFFETMPAAQRPTTQEAVQTHMMNPGGMAKLMQWETGKTNTQTNERYGMINVGSVPAHGEWNQDPQYFPNSDAHLQAVLDRQQAATGLAYSFKVAPGSQRQKDSVSGGAVGPQLMPVWANYFTCQYDAANALLPASEKLPEPNIWDPFTALVLADMYISSSFYGRSTDINRPDHNYPRPGYQKGDKDQSIRSLKKWNPYDEEVNSTYNAAVDFYKNFPEY